MLQPFDVAIFSAVSKSFRDVGKCDEYWVSAGISFIMARDVTGCKFHDPSAAGMKLSRVRSSFVDRCYSHPGYRAYCWFRERTFNLVAVDERLDSHISRDFVSCVWRNWVFNPLRANQWTSERRVQVWMQYLERKCKVWFPLPKTYIVGFYDRFPCDPFLLQTPDFNLQVLLSNPKFTCSLREKHSMDLKKQLHQLEREKRVLEESLIQNRCLIGIIQTVLRENGVS